jgi:hypothetical protein
MRMTERAAKTLWLPLPEQWRSERVDDRFIVLFGGLCGMVTIDLEHRCFRAGGYMFHGVPSGDRHGRDVYAGPRWHERLHRDAVSFLQESSK